jgi:hypothetical protein
MRFFTAWTLCFILSKSGGIFHFFNAGIGSGTASGSKKNFNKKFKTRRSFFLI